ncbi:Serine proteinase [Halorhabdus tiamatea SARL4B]|uniref:Serine protease HtrA n=1 Tax=Halorhabdus tiamatea SARL4B TaxID=1033806 RepID=F7PND1_9EURY|nr:trypsin-like peptidase domain-containing protein [Halorhabdus tiamatea]ERJ05082.1 Serine proteinase [Halorhabdus tiamatea SARL4B]CCQ34605.1 serine protease HtrA [Halorhabdus tiamatea SARL4B]
MPPEELSRRRFLGLLGASTALGAAGCADSPSAETVDPVPSDTGTDDSPELTTDTPDVDAQSRYTDVYRSVSDSVVQIRVITTLGSAGTGSGFVYDDTHLVTNEHVVADAQELYVRYPSTGWRQASVVGTDLHSDLAVLSVDAHPSAADPLSFVDREPAIGTEVVAIGNPYGLSGSVSAGIVSGVDRTLAGPNNFSIPDTIQTDAAVNPGNSGGPLVNLGGEVVGLISAGRGDNIGLAISSALTRRVVPSLIETGSYEHPYLGIGLRDVTPAVARANDLPEISGVYVTQVLEGSPSDGVLQGATGETTVDGRPVPVGGDVITHIEGEPTPISQQLASVLALQTEVGQPATIRVWRDGTAEDLQVTIGSRDDAN